MGLPVARSTSFRLRWSQVYFRCMATPAYAYVDPSVMTYTIQALAGVAVALSAVLGVALRRTRKMLFKMLRIDENAGKVVEAPVHRLDKDGKPILAPGEIAADAELDVFEEGFPKGTRI